MVLSVGEGWREETQNASVQVVIKTRAKETRTEKNGDAKTRLHCLRVGHTSLQRAQLWHITPLFREIQGLKAGDR